MQEGDTRTLEVTVLHPGGREQRSWIVVMFATCLICFGTSHINTGEIFFLKIWVL